MIRAVLLLLLLPSLAQADVLRIATYNTELSRKGPGLLLRDIQRSDPQVTDVVTVISTVSPDVIALQGIDWDHDGLALNALADLLSKAGIDYPHRYSSQPNSGIETALDLDGDGRTFGPGDAQGWGEFSGQGGLAVLSRYPIINEAVVEFTNLLWRDLPGAQLPQTASGPFPTAEAQAQQRLSSTAHWAIPIDAPAGRFHLMTFHASPPVFDGPEDRNGLRNRDEIRLWQAYLDGALGPAHATKFVLAGDANLDPHDSDGRTETVRTLLSDPRLQDPAPQSAGAARAGNQNHRSPDAHDTVDWPGIGRFRVDYVLPSSDWSVADAGVYWPAPDVDGHEAASRASRHRLVWVDLLAE